MGEAFITMTQNTKAIKEKIDTFNYIKIKQNSVWQKNITKRQKTNNNMAKMSIRERAISIIYTKLLRNWHNNLR